MESENAKNKMQITSCPLFKKTKMSSSRKERTGREEEEMRRGGIGILDNKDKLTERKKRMKIFMDIGNIGCTWY